MAIIGTQIKDLTSTIIMVPSFFKIGQKLTELWPVKNIFLKNSGNFFTSNLAVKLLKMVSFKNPFNMT